MEKAKFTPGPWEAECYGQGGFEITATSRRDGENVDRYWILCSRNEIDFRAEESSANAHLIRTAPEMYTLLDGCRAFVVAWAVTHAGVDDIEKAHPEHVKFFKKIETVLAKARGEGE